MPLVTEASGPAKAHAPAPRVVVVEGDELADVFEVVSLVDLVIRVRAPYRFERGEELALKIEQGGVTREATAKVRAHTADGITELELAPA